MQNYKLDSIWPTGYRRIGRAKLRKLDDVEFAMYRKRSSSRVHKLTNSARAAKKLSRKIELRRRDQKQVRLRASAMLARPRACSILSAFYPKRMENWDENIVRRKRGGVIDCQNFSFFDEPEKTLQSFSEIAKAEAHEAQFEINFLDPLIFDIAPFLVFGALRANMAPLINGGKMSNSAMKVLDAVGAREFLHMRFGTTSHKDVWPIKLRQRRKTGTSNKSTNIAVEASTIEKTADAIVNSMDNWLEVLEPSLQMTQWGRGQVKSAVDEILDNAQRHSDTSEDGEWTTAGFMAKRELTLEGRSCDVHICHLAFLNSGMPFSKSLESAPDFIKSQIEKYVSIHKRAPQSAETLATAFALQDGISRVQYEDGTTGGTGIMDIVQAAIGVSEGEQFGLKPEIAILSGRAYILFAGKYLLQDDEEPLPDGSTRRLQWFNVENSPEVAPDQTHVRDLPLEFPGTLITLRFPLSVKSSLEEKNDGANHD